ncbi:hypothetical protein CVT26_003141 [Gymnopilus dilepis]|uniref:Uncharacterized protein n=1 Tax=Gymnopilus dilepis TaxID=231916 RepID=A0A409Y4L0_9AGAR|nr:hypothetical protein CVT26_003141 [Gymnopilus dilepis]
MGRAGAASVEDEVAGLAGDHPSGSAGRREEMREDFVRKSGQGAEAVPATTSNSRIDEERAAMCRVRRVQDEGQRRKVPWAVSAGRAQSTGCFEDAGTRWWGCGSSASRPVYVNAMAYSCIAQDDRKNLPCLPGKLKGKGLDTVVVELVVGLHIAVEEDTTRAGEEEKRG